MDIQNYNNYTLQDFLEDDQFVKWVINPNALSDGFWQTVKLQYPAKAKLIGEASRIIIIYRKQNVFNNEAGMASTWSRIEKGLSVKQTPAKRIISFRPYLRIAAMLLAIITVSLIFWLSNRSKTILTAYGEVRTVTLPDQSVVVLNANSSLKYTNNWDSHKREVWISGEGFFKIKHINKDPRHIKDNERFIVHCPDLNIEVLGTTFNVKARNEKTDVSLITGKIMIDYKDGNKQENVKGLVLKPGDFIEYARRHIATKLKLAQPEVNTHWTQQPLWFTNAKLKDIAEVLEDNYGYEVTFTDSALEDRRIEGDIKVTNVNQLLETITTTLHVHVLQKSNQINISPLNPN